MGVKLYNIGFQYDTEADCIKKVYCDCPAFRSYSGICKHCVAVLLEYGDRKAYERVEVRKQQDEDQKQAEIFSGTEFPAAVSGSGQPATKTTVELKSLLNRQMYSRMLPFLRGSVFWQGGAGNLSEIQFCGKLLYRGIPHWL